MKNKKYLNLESKKGQAMIISAIFFLFLSMGVVLGSVGPISEQIDTSDDLIVSKSTYYTSEAGSEDAIYRLKNGITISGSEVITIGDATATTTITDLASGKQVTSSSSERNLNRFASTTLGVSGIGAAFGYGMQIGNGGVQLNNSASVTGNVISSGEVEGTGSPKNLITGSVISTGASGRIDNLRITGNAYAHNIEDSTITGDAYYGCATLPATCFTNTTVAGTKYPNSADQPTASLPITDAMVSDLEAVAAAGGTHTSPCNYNISGTVSLGPIKINCDVYIFSTAVVTLTGPVWVSGNIDIDNSAQIRVSSSLGAQSGVLIADKISNRDSSSRISITNSASFQGSGHPNSNVVLISMNNSAETGGWYYALTMSNNSGGNVILYAPHGIMNVSNSVSVKNITAYQLYINNSANVTYDSGLANQLFSGGGGGGYSIEKWKESQ